MYVCGPVVDLPICVVVYVEPVVVVSVPFVLFAESLSAESLDVVPSFVLFVVVVADAVVVCVGISFSLLCINSRLPLGSSAWPGLVLSLLLYSKLHFSWS